MAALSLVAYLFFRCPSTAARRSIWATPSPPLTALLLDGVSGGSAGAIGLALADVLAGDPGYAITTFVLKFIIGITCGAVAHKGFKLKDLDPHAKGYPCPRSSWPPARPAAQRLTRPVPRLFPQRVHFRSGIHPCQGPEQDRRRRHLRQQRVVSTVCVVLLYLALRPGPEHAKLLTKGEKK